MINILTTGDVFSYWGAYIIQNLTDTEIKLNNIPKINIKELREMVSDEEHSGIILLGVPVEENQVRIVDDTLEPLTGFPFITCEHYANWGSKLVNTQSYVDQEQNYLVGLVNNIVAGNTIYKFADKEAEELALDIVDSLQSYHTFEANTRKERGDQLILLSDFYKEGLVGHGNYSNIEGLLDANQGVINRLKINRTDYINRKLEQAVISRLDTGTLVVTLNAERHINEIGESFINGLGKGADEVIVLIGHTTRGDDLYHIRTSEGVNAGEVARTLNYGDGKEHVATVFLSKANQPIYNTIYKVLNSADV